jgi:hypothetical protein
MPTTTTHQSSGLSAKDHALANMFQRLPGHALAAINPLRPSNFAALEIPLHAPRDVVANPGSNRGDVFSQWKSYTLPHEATLRDALAAIERANSSTKRARKFQLNFTNGAHMVLSRDDPDDPTSLVFQTVYNPGQVYQQHTARSVERGRGENDSKLKFVADERGRLMNRRPESASSFSPQRLFREAPNPITRGHDGYAFTAMSALSHQLRPNRIITGVRPGLRETSPDATYFRPRPVSAAFAAKATLSADRGATPMTSLYPTERVDHRYRTIPAPPKRPHTAAAAASQ